MSETSVKEKTQKRLHEIESEIEALKEKREKLRERWNKEKNTIQSIREYKAKIDEAKIKAEKYEREGNLAKVAEIRYGEVHELERKLKEANDKLKGLQASGKMLKEEVDDEDIAEVVARWTGIPVSRMLESERAKLIKMEDRIHQRLINQNEAVEAVANAIRRSRAGIQDENRPIGSFIFLGSTGVGKTEMARSLAEFLFDDENSMVRIDMSEYMEKHSVSRLIGAPPGYIGYEEGGQLTEAIRQKPYSVVLLDEIEKANTEVFNVLLQALDDGRLTDGKGRKVNFKNTIIIMTSNTGSSLIQERLVDISDSNRDEVMDNLKPDIMKMLRDRMKPEFLNRIDEIILFKPLTSKEIFKIADLNLKRLKQKLSKNGIEFEITGDALALLSKIGYDVQYGARPLKRAIQKNISDKLAMKLLAGDISSGDKVLVDSGEKNFIFKKV